MTLPMMNEPRDVNGPPPKRQEQTTIFEILRASFGLIVVSALILVVLSYLLFAWSLRLSSEAAGANGIVFGAWGLLLSVLGFSLTIYQLRQATSAANAASYAVNELKFKILSYNAIVEAQKALAFVRETQRHVKASSWESAIFAYSGAGESIVRLLDLPSSLVEGDRNNLALILTDTQSFCDRAENFLIKNTAPMDRGKVLKSARAHEQRLIKISTAFQRELIA